MKKLFLSLTAILSIAAFYSCGKIEIVNANDFAGKWNLASEVKKGYTQKGELLYTNTNGGSANDYYDFQSGGILKTSVGGQSETLGYIQIDANKIVIDNGSTYDTAQVITNFKKAITILRKIRRQDLGTNAYEEIYADLRK